MEHEKLQKAEGRAIQQELNLTGIPAQMKWDLEARSGLSLDDVRVHYHSDQPAKLGALAYTQGTQVHIGPGQEGRLPHELGHVVQQKLGLVRPNARLPGGTALNTEEALERQADAIGAGQSMLSAGMQPVQRYEDPVVQAAGRISNISSPEPRAGELDLPPAPGPTIVFEAMGVDMGACMAVYEETTRYGGNTICVFGLNAKTDAAGSVPDNQQTDLAGYRDACNGNTTGPYRHLLYTFSFTWEELTGDNRGYAMPFVEARILVMQQAATIVESLLDSSDSSPQYEFVYRWIDADAENDTAASLDPSKLNAFAKESGAAVMTGRYNWRSEVSGTAMAKYKAFIQKFNQAEKELRDYYYLLLSGKKDSVDKDSVDRILALQHRSGYGDDERQEIEKIKQYLHGAKYIIDPAILPKPDQNSYLPGYYLPETVLMMNQQAHQNIVRVFPRAGTDPARALGRAGVSSRNAPQDKESMRLVSLLTLPTVSYQSKLSVTKPLKNELTDGTYWGSNMLEFLKGEGQSEDDFVTALKNVRQSAFKPGHWYFITDENWDKWESARAPAAGNDLEEKQALFNKKRRELKAWLLQFLNEQVEQGQTQGQTQSQTQSRTRTRTVREVIAEEISPPSA